MFHVNTFNLGTPYVGDYVGSLELLLGNHNLDDGNIGLGWHIMLLHCLIWSRMKRTRNRPGTFLLTSHKLKCPMKVVVSYLLV